MKKIWWILLVMVFYSQMGARMVSAEVIAIGNQSVPVASLSLSEVQDIFLGKTVKWQDGSKINFAVLKGDIHAEFLKAFIKRTDSQFTAYWKQMLFTGKGGLPKNFETEKEMVQYVSETPGAIGYINKTTAPEKTKVISVN